MPSYFRPLIVTLMIPFVLRAAPAGISLEEGRKTGYLQISSAFQVSEGLGATADTPPNQGHVTLQFSVDSAGKLTKAPMNVKLTYFGERYRHLSGSWKGVTVDRWLSHW